VLGQHQAGGKEGLFEERQDILAANGVGGQQGDLVVQIGIDGEGDVQGVAQDRLGDRLDIDTWEIQADVAAPQHDDGP
jgi:hypothetical protein